MRKTARKELPEEDFSEIREEYSAPVSTVENPLMEDLHTVAPSAVPAWKTPSVVVDQKKKDPFRNNGMFVSIDQEIASSDQDIRPTAPANATIISEEEVKEMFSYTDEQLEYRKDMKFGEKLRVTFRKTAVWFSDLWDKYVLFMKNHFPVIFESHEVSKVTTVACCILFILVGLVVVISIKAR